MMNLAEYRCASTGLADFLPLAALVDEGVVLNAVERRPIVAIGGYRRT